MKTVFKRMMAIVLVAAMTAVMLPMTASAETAENFTLIYRQNGEEHQLKPGETIPMNLSINDPAYWADRTYGFSSAVGVSSVSLSGSEAGLAMFNAPELNSEENTIWVYTVRYNYESDEPLGTPEDLKNQPETVSLDIALENGKTVSFPLKLTFTNLPFMPHMGDYYKDGTPVEIGEGEELEIAKTPITVTFKLVDQAGYFKSGDKLVFEPKREQSLPGGNTAKSEAVDLTNFDKIQIRVKFTENGQVLHQFGFAKQGEPVGFSGWIVDYVITGKADSGSTGGKESSSPGDNNANSGSTTDKVKDTADIFIKQPNIDPQKSNELPVGVKTATTAGGGTVAAIPVALTTGSATVGTDLFNTLGGSSAKVGLQLTVGNGMGGGSAEIIIPGGFGKITEPGRISYPMDYKNKADDHDTMIKGVKNTGTETAVSVTAKVGGNFELPVAATVTVPVKLPGGQIVSIYRYDPATGTFTVIGKAVVKDGKLTFATKIMGEMLFTTGTL